MIATAVRTPYRESTANLDPISGSYGLGIQGYEVVYGFLCAVRSEGIGVSKLREAPTGHDF